MRMIERSSAFRKDYRREYRGRHGKTLDSFLLPVLKALEDGTPLQPRYRDHELSGAWMEYRECHLKPDLLLIYRKAGEDILRLARLGSHSELFG